MLIDLEPSSVIMPMYTRTLLFAGRHAYNIQETINRVRTFCESNPELTRQDDMVEAIMKLVDLKYDAFIDFESFILCPFTREYLQVGRFFYEWGVQEDLPYIEDGSVSTFSLENDSLPGLDGESIITDDEELEIVDVAHILWELNPENNEN